MSELKRVCRRVFELEWDADAGQDWMNIFNLELCLYSKEHTRRDLLRVRELKQVDLPLSSVESVGLGA